MPLISSVYTGQLACSPCVVMLMKIYHHQTNLLNKTSAPHQKWKRLESAKQRAQVVCCPRLPDVEDLLKTKLKKNPITHGTMLWNNVENFRVSHANSKSHSTLATAWHDCIAFFGQSFLRVPAWDAWQIPASNTQQQWSAIRLGTGRWEKLVDASPRKSQTPCMPFIHQTCCHVAMWCYTTLRWWGQMQPYFFHPCETIHTDKMC